jgi:hypothetical protein
VTSPRLLVPGSTGVTKFPVVAELYKFLRIPSEAHMEALPAVVAERVKLPVKPVELRVKFHVVGVNCAFMF